MRAECVRREYAMNMLPTFPPLPQSHGAAVQVPIDPADPPAPAEDDDDEVFLSGRKPFPGLEAIYVMLPDLENIDLLLGAHKEVQRHESEM